MGTNRIIIDEKDHKERLDRLLVREFPGHSRSFWQKAVKEGAVSVNGNAASPHHFLKKGDIVEINRRETDSLAKARQMNLEPDGNMPLDVVFENESLAIINKPAGLVVHPSITSPEKTLVNALLARYPEIRGVGEDESRPGIVHRLDKDASGLMVVAKNQKTYEHLKRQFKERLAKKEYLALAKGKVSPERGIIDRPIGRSVSIPAKMSIRPKGEGRAALTEYELIEYYGNCSLLRVKIKTGRTHQIRVHLSSIGHPLVGDKIYKPRKTPMTEEEIKLGRIFLHAARLEIECPDGKHREFESPLPPELDKLLDSLRK